ncbi:hypothetical protein BD779DRAFT_433028 [Infundibulicybe gibba]|nr:hypothetical protein BD779DRAFT_433028 [Infundibulicybe gibba]
MFIPLSIPSTLSQSSTIQHWVIVVLRAADAFIYKVDGNADVFYLDLRNPKGLAKDILLICQIIVADSTMVYRLYIVWGRSWRKVLIPLILTILLVGSGFGAIDIYGRFASEQYNPPAISALFVVVFFGATLILNIVISGLISYHIWSINHRIAQFTGQRHRINLIIHILLEGAVLYVGCLCFSLVGFMTRGSTYQFILLDVTSPLTGIAFCLIIVWVGLDKGVESTTQVLNNLRFNHQSGNRA